MSREQPYETHSSRREFRGSRDNAFRAWFCIHPAHPYSVVICARTVAPVNAWVISWTTAAAESGTVPSSFGPPHVFVASRLNSEGGSNKATPSTFAFGTIGTWVVKSNERETRVSE